MMSVFLMGVYDKSCDRFRTVAKCGNGHDDAKIEKLQTELDMVKISKDPSKVPAWLLVNKTVIPDFVVRDPKAAPVWEITGAEFSKSTAHTAGGISIRFPRVTRIRDDKDWTNATDLERLKTLFKASKETTDIPGLTGSGGGKSDENGADEGDTEEDEEEEAMDTKPPTSSPAKTPKKSPIKKQPQRSLLPQSLGNHHPSWLDLRDPDRRERKTSEKWRHRWLRGEKANVNVLGQHKCAGVAIPKPLADIFTGVTVYIDPSVSKAEDLRRYFVSYDGEVVDEYHKSSADYYIMDTASSTSATTSVKPEWVWDCLKKASLLPTAPYTH
ncbi:DNA ligase 3 [Geodia barretti]|uniref:DNA ligase 3 n=1 Tax=Geodia barretti TaxID=519541 RepID=A0AA35TNA8_GEOBA|nr:DNA ligase 3 [Geodia barretti]